MGIYFSMVWGLLLGDLAGWQAAAASFPPFRSSSSPLPPHPGLGEDIQSISEVGCRIQPQLYLPATWVGRSPDPFRDVRLTSLSPLSGCLACPVSCTRNGSGFMLGCYGGRDLDCQLHEKGGEGRAGEKKFLFRIGGRKSPKNGSVRDLTLWFRIKDGEQRDR